MNNDQIDGKSMIASMVGSEESLREEMFATTSIHEGSILGPPQYEGGRLPSIGSGSSTSPVTPLTPSNRLSLQ